jgi:hypothetical protein
MCRGNTPDAVRKSLTRKGGQGAKCALAIALVGTLLPMWLSGIFLTVSGVSLTADSG